MTESEIVAFLSAGENYGLPGEPVEHIETHCSFVFLICDRAYKLKRPIAFSALDYTSVERREAACRRELELNRRTAPDLYLDVRAVRRSEDGSLTFAGTGPAVDWLVVMRRFNQEDLFDRLAAAGRLDSDLAAALAVEIARFHRGAERVDHYGGRDGLMRAIEQNRHDQLTVAAILGKAATDDLYARSLDLLDRVASLLDRRRARGCVRRCHGDLRLANICLWRGHPTLFDAIEFADEPACIDILYDLAFLLMDLWQRGLRSQANIVFNQYLDRAGDDDGLASLPLMLSVRAGTRAFAVAAASGRKISEAHHLALAAQDFMTLAQSLLDTRPSCLIAIGGGTEPERADLVSDLAPSFDPPPGARIIQTAEAGIAAQLPALGAALESGYQAIVARSFEAKRDLEELGNFATATSISLTGLWLGEPPRCPSGWKAIRLAAGARPSVATVHRLIGGAGAQPRAQATPSPLRHEAGETRSKRD